MRIDENKLAGTLLIKKVETQYRLRLPKDVAQQISWLSATEGFTQSCLARVGPHEQLQILANERQPTALHQLRKSLASRPATAEEIGEPWFELARYDATVWPLSCSFESKGNRFTFVLPKEPRDLGIAPGENDTAAIFISGEIVEIWPAQKWLQHVSAISSKLGHYTSVAIEELTDRA